MSINLLPPQIKNEKRFRSIFREATFGLLAILALVLLFTGAFLVYFAFLKTSMAKTEKEITVVNQELVEYKDVEQKILEINSRLTKIDEANEDRVLWSHVLELIGQSTPKNVKIKTLALNQSSNAFSLTGTAIDRREIALMKEKLEAANDFKNVTFSSSSFNQGANDYGFSLNFELNK